MAINVVLSLEKFIPDFNAGGTNLSKDLKKHERALSSNHVSIRFLTRFDSPLFENKKGFFSVTDI